MSIRSLLRHRAEVRRATPTLTDGITYTTWPVVTEALVCLLDVGTTGQPEPTLTPDQQRTLDRTGMLLTLPTVDLKPGDRLRLIRGSEGTFVVLPEPSLISTLSGPSHREWRVEEVPS